MLVLEQLHSWTLPPLTSRQFPSGLRVLHTSAFTAAAFASRLLGVLLVSEPYSTTDIARNEGLTLSMAVELIQEVEVAGEVCRDDLESGAESAAHTSPQTKWWANRYDRYTWDGQ